MFREDTEEPAVGATVLQMVNNNKGEMVAQSSFTLVSAEVCQQRCQLLPAVMVGL